MARTHFTVGEVEELIPKLERIFTYVLQLRAGLRAMEAVFRGFYEALSDEIENVRALGGQVKDIDSGLVDFPGRRGPEEILLCWKLGEKKIEFWHTVNGGFSSRRPIDEQIPRLPQRLD